MMWNMTRLSRDERNDFVIVGTTENVPVGQISKLVDRDIALTSCSTIFIR